MKQPETISNKTSNRNKKKGPNWLVLTGWGLAILFMGGTLWIQKQQQDLDKTLQAATTHNEELYREKGELEKQLAEKNKTLQILRSKEFQASTLIGNQAVAPQAFAKVYLDKKARLAYVDAKGLPAPVKGKVYQLWSLKMEPFNAINIGVMDEANRSGIDIHKFENFPEPETLCITLEPSGGSETPTISQIYVLEMRKAN